jgi:hypothetical protein
MGNSIINVVDANNPGGNRRSVDLLPNVFRTDKNTKFLSGTLDQLIQPASVEKISGWVGSKITPTYDPKKDFYLKETIPFRKKYQLEPAVVVTDSNQNITKAFSYDDLINQLAFDGAMTNDLNRLFTPEIYSYDPHIEWDKFVNFDQYYWMPEGPDSITITGVAKSTSSTYTVTDDKLKQYFILTPDGLTENPLLTLYRGVTYIFNVDSSHKFWIKTQRTQGTSFAFTDTVTNNGIDKGQIILTVDDNTPKKLYYVAEDNEIAGGEIVVKPLIENTIINVDKEVVGKQYYTSNTGVALSNGMKIKFDGEVIPSKYSGKEFFVEGVGTAIKLIDVSVLQTPEVYSDYLDDNFDATPFDKYPFDDFLTLPIYPEYITINRASEDRNPWSRYNRWTHADVLIATAKANNADIQLPQEYRAKRPIIEFKPNLQLANFGRQAAINIQHVDTFTTDAFSNAEGQIGYYIDEILVEAGDRVVFAADTDPLVRNKIYKVEFLNNDGTFRLHFAEDEHSQVKDKDSVVVTKGVTHQGTSWWFDASASGVWVAAQHKTKLNQAPLFDVFDANGISYLSSSNYNADFVGTKIFGYSVGTGTADPVLGFPLQYRNVADQGYYLFSNYFMTDAFTNVMDEVSSSIQVNSGFLKLNGKEDSFINVWTESTPYPIPVLQYQVIENSTSNVTITAIANLGYIDFQLDVFVNNIKLIDKKDYAILASKDVVVVNFFNSLSINDKVLFKIYSNGKITDTGVYETSIGYTNNPLNGPNSRFTLSELSDHARSMAERDPDFSGNFIGKNNIRDLPDFNKYGTRLIVNKNPLSFSNYFVCDRLHDVVKATRKIGLQYNQFKLNLLKASIELKNVYANPADALDVVLHNINLTRDGQYPFSQSDMLAYGPNVISRDYKVTDARITQYTLPNGQFTLDKLSLRSVLVYHNNEQLLNGIDYTFDPYLAVVNITTSLKKGDVITVKDYSTTDGCFVPLTPTKLGLFPAFEPKKYVDDTYATPQTVIQGHDGSINIAYGDIRDTILLEYEKRVYNNIKTRYNQDLLDMNSVLAGGFRNNLYSYFEISRILEKEFLKWAGFYGFDYTSNNLVNDNPKTYNYRTAKNYVTGRPLPGHWRGIFKYFYDTDRPHTYPWEMLGFTVKPAWWESVYGPAPYTKGNLLLWGDLAEGKIADPANTRVNPLYIRPGLLDMIPVDDTGNLLDPGMANAALNVNPINIGDNWQFGDQGPTETAWRRSSLWPFAVQILLAVTRPADYFSLMFDPSRMKMSPAGQYVYTDTGTFLNPTKLSIYGDNGTLAAGYGAFLVEAGRQTTKNYISTLKQELGSINLQLLHKVGGFVSKDKLEITIDSVSPSTANPGVALNSEDYTVFLNQGSPIAVQSISGLIIQHTDAGYLLKGYDRTYPYFTIYKPEYTQTDTTLTVGGKSEPYVEWKASSLLNDNAIQIGTAETSTAGANFYQTGQVVSYNNAWYRVKVSHTSGATFNNLYFTQIQGPNLIGGVSVVKPRKFETVETLIPYGTVFATVQDVYDVICGYSEWLTAQGFVFDEFQADLSQILNWEYAAKEFLYWSSQGWAVNSVITISPFANGLKYQNPNGIVDNVLNRFYEYSILKADGTILPINKLSMQRLDNTFTIKTVNTLDGIYFAQLNVIQKEHNIILNNASYFNDIIYDIESGYRQHRIKLKGFRTANWSGSLNSPGFVYDEAVINDWTEYTDYNVGDITRFNGNYYSAATRINGTSTFVFHNWEVLGSKPVKQLLPNFDYKISQFEDFYSLDIDSFDAGQQKLAQHLVGYSPRTYLDNIFTDQITQYKFYQGFIKEKGTRNSINRLDKASIASLQTSVDFNEEWAFRIGDYGSFTTNQNIEIALDQQAFKENPQIINFVDRAPYQPNNFAIYKTESDLLFKPDNYNNSPFPVTMLEDLDPDTILPTAGYVRIDEVDATAYSKASLLDIANNKSINEGTSIWLGFREDGDWDVYRYTLTNIRVTNVALTYPGSYMTVTTNYAHNLSVGDIISISQFSTEIDGVFLVRSVEDYNQITVSTSLNTISNTFQPAVGLLYKFASSRHASLDALANNPLLVKYNAGERVWIDQLVPGVDNRWSVYQKTDAYSKTTSTNYDPGINLVNNQTFGSKISVNTMADVVLIGSPNYQSTLNSGGHVSVYRKLGTDKNQLTKLLNVQLSSSQQAASKLGTSITSYYDEDTDPLNPTIDIISGAPGGQGLVKIVRLNLTNLTSYEVAVITAPVSGKSFGQDLYLASKGKLYIGSPGEGKVYYIADYNTSSTPVVMDTRANGYGTSISGSGSLIAVGSPNEDKVYAYNNNSLTGTISCPADYVAGYFGKKLAMTADGTILISSDTAQSVLVYSTGTTYSLSQIITAPDLTNDVKFGVDIAVYGNSVVVTSAGTGIGDTVFDNTKPGTNFDSSSTVFINKITASGNVYVYNKLSTKYVLGQTLKEDQPSNNSAYGYSAAIGDSYIIIGAPGQISDSSQTGKIYIFDQKAGVTQSWNQVHVEEDVVDIRLVNRAFTLDNVNDKIVDYLEIIDPIKGRIPGNAEQEIKYKTVFDPAVYSIGITGTVNDTKTNWLDDHIGELWWDLSNAKYVNYEQGDLEFRRNNWNRLFPGCSIDVYEWVRSKYLPSQWSALADTNEGLAQGISGQPKFVDNSVVSIKQIYNATGGNFTNVYYYWVKNKVTIPSQPNRRTSAFEVANLIADPKAQGLKYTSVIAKNALMLTNIKPTLKDNSINLSVEIDSIDSDIKKHTEWLLLRENEPNSYIDLSSPLLQKLLDSLLGRDPLGNPVPDPTLPDRQKYGVGFRPRQSMFKDRLGALRAFIEYINSVFKNQLINETGYNFTKLYATEQPDNSADGTWDITVFDNIARSQVVTRYWRQGQLQVNLKNGRIDTVNIIDSGFDYGRLSGLDTDEFGNYITWKGPVVTFLGDGDGAEIRTIVDSNGSIVKTIIVNKGSGYTFITPTVRPHAVIVTVDDSVNNRWSKYEWSYDTKTYTRTHTQSYNVTNYWTYIDWSSADYIKNRTISKTLDYTYQLPVISVPAGSYVRINNPGDSKYIILKKLDLTNQPGTFNIEYDIVFKENGTIQFLDTIWNNSLNNYGYDSNASWDQTPFSQTNDKEVELIVQALLIDILNGQLQIVNNKIWFKAVKYAMSEQKFLDWAFKTSFIYLNHNAGQLDQRPTYKLQNTSYYESYINETKPYHSKIRNFKSTYTTTEMTTAYPTDFDLPSYYATATNSFGVVSMGNPLLLQQPYVNWFNNYTFTVSNVVVYDGGNGYRTPPQVNLISVDGDPGFGAKANAYIALGQVTQIIVTDPGQGYVTAPIVQLVGGGNANIVPARASARISNGKVRNNTIKMRFDRVSGSNEIGDQRTVDTFTGDGSTREYKLSWYPETVISNFTVKRNGILVLSSNYSLSNYTAQYNGYNKKYSTIVLGFVPASGDVITVAYNKNIDLYHAVDRIRDYYSPTAGMPGNTATMLMTGLEYPGVTIDTLPMRNSAGWDTIGWDSSTWDDYDLAEGFYSVFGSHTTSTFQLPYTPKAGQKLNIYVTTTSTGEIVTRRIDDPYFGTTASTNVYATTSTFIGNGQTNVINIGTLTSVDTIIDFRLSGQDGAVTPNDVDIDTFIYGGTWTNALTTSDGLTDVNMDGDGFVTPDNSYGPEENLPGRVSDTLGISVYSRPSTSAPVVTSRKYIVDGSNLTLDIGVKPANSSSIQVLLGESLLNQGVDYNIDFANDQIVLFTATSTVSTTTDVTGPYFSSNSIIPRKEGFFTSVAQFNADDSYQGPFDLGFDWNMFGTKFNQVYIGTNGYLTFGGGSAQYTPVLMGSLPYPAIYVEYTDLWEGYGPSGQPLNTGETPGIFYSTGTVGNFKYFRMRFQGTHYITRNNPVTIPAYDYECTLYSDGVNQYVENIYEIIPSTIHGLGANDIGAVFGIAPANSANNSSTYVAISPQSVENNTSHVFYSTQNGGNWKYAGKGSFDAFKPQGQITTLSTSSPKALSITTLGVGGIELLESGSVVVNSLTPSTTNFVFASSFKDVKSYYVTVNGVSVSNFSIVSSDGRATVSFSSGLNIGDVLQVWFFDAPVKAFNEVKEQVFANVNTTTFTLSQPPGITGPFHNQALVTFNGQRLLPPDIVYYVAADGVKTYPITHGINYSTIDSLELQVFVNGQEKNPGRDFQFIEDSKSIAFKSNKIKDGDAIAVVLLKSHDYEINNNILTLTSQVLRTGNDTLRVTTYTNHDGLAMRKERFTGTGHGRYLLSRQVPNTNYVWVDVNGYPLIAEAEYKLDLDKQTVRLTKKLDSTDNVVITSIESGAHELIGFRIFYDNFGRTHYKRLSGKNTTQLVSDLLPGDKSITVLDGSTLTPPDIANRIPGVILVDGERIEFYQLIGNELTQLKRGALGTGIKSRHVSGTTVVDQGVAQTVRIVDTPQTQTVPTALQSDISNVAVITSSTPAIIKVPLVVTTTSTTYTRGVVSSILGYGGPLTYTISPIFAPSYTTLQPFDSSQNTIVGHIPTAGEESWFVMSEISVGGVGKENKSWFTNLQTRVASTGTTSQVYISFITTSGSAVYNIDTVFAGDILENSIKAFSSKTVTDTKSGSTSTVWYIKGALDTRASSSATFEAGKPVTIQWNNVYTGPTQFYSIPHTVVNTTIVKDGQTATTTVFTSTEILSTGTIFELNGIDFRGSANDVSRQVSVYYQGRQLQNSLMEIQKQNVNVAYDSGEINSVGINSTDIVPNEYQISQYLNRYFLEVFVPVSVASELKIVKNSTQVWYDINSNSSLTDQNTEQIRFLRSSPARLPDKYLYGQNTDSIPVYVEELGGTIDSETGEPLVGE